jgi:hypothetical protein
MGFIKYTKKKLNECICEDNLNENKDKYTWEKVIHHYQVIFIIHRVI